MAPTVRVPASGASCCAIMRKSVVLPAPLAPMTPDDAAAGQGEVEVLEEEPVAVALGEPLRDDDLVSEPRRPRDQDFRGALADAIALGQHLLVPG